MKHKRHKKQKISDNNYVDFLSKTIEDWKIEESMWDPSISTHFVFRNSSYFERKNTYDKCNDDIIRRFRIRPSETRP